MQGMVRYTGPGPGGSVVRNMDSIPVNGQRIADAYGYRLYDQFRFQSGTAVSQAPFRFFITPQGQQQAGQNFTTQYFKTLIDTNLEQAGAVPKGRYFEVHSIQCRILMLGATDTTVGSSGIATQIPTNAAGAATISATNEIVEVLEGGFMTFVVDSKNYEQGKLIHFPTPYGVSGFAGGGIPGTSNTDVVAVANNGFGRPYRLPVPRKLDGLRQFYVEAVFPYAFTPNRNFRMEIALEGVLLRSVT